MDFVEEIESTAEQVNVLRAEELVKNLEWTTEKKNKGKVVYFSSFTMNTMTNNKLLPKIYGVFW